MTDEAFLQRAPEYIEALNHVFAKNLDDDSLNQLVLTAGITGKEVDVIRGYSNYFRQISFKLSAARIEEILVSHPVTCSTLIQLFRVRF